MLEIYIIISIIILAIIVILTIYSGLSNKPKRFSHGSFVRGTKVLTKIKQYGMIIISKE